MEQLRKDGNELFKCGDYEGALTAYTQALGLGATPQDQAILHRNRAACHLKLVREPAALPLACPGPGLPISPPPGLRLDNPRPPTAGFLLGLPEVGDRVTLDSNPCCPVIARKGEEQSLRLLFFLSQEDYDKAETEASKGRERAPCGAVRLPCRAGRLGLRPHLLRLLPLKHTCILSFPLPRAFPFLQLPSPFLRLKYYY